MQIKVEPAATSPASPATREDGQVHAVEAENLVRRFGDMEALARVSVKIRKGEFFSLLGPSGCGKTTLLRIIAGLDAPDEGVLRIGGRDAATIPAHQRPVNTVFQSYALFPHLSVRDNIAFGLRMKRVAAGDIPGRVGRMMDLAQITPFADRKPGQLSGGQKQRVALARALVNEPEVLLLDEPLGALDLKLRKELQVELQQLQRRLGITFIFVTHDQEEALVMSHRIAVMNAGRIEQLDAGADLYERPRTRFVAQFLGACNLLPARLRSRSGPKLGLETALGDFSAEAGTAGRNLAAGDKLTLAIRPEKVGFLAGDPADGPNRFRAQIETLIYSGAETQYRMRANGQLINVCALNSRAGHQGLDAGQTVLLHFPEDALVVLED